MARNKSDEATIAIPATSATRKKVRGLMGVLEAEANGEEWVVDASNPLTGIGLGASPEAKRLMMVGYYSEQTRIINDQLARMKPKKGRPKVSISIDTKRAAAVLSANDFFLRKTGKSLPTQKAAIELAAQFDKLLFDIGKIDKLLFDNMSSMKRFQDSVSKGLRELGEDSKRFLK